MQKTASYVDFFNLYSRKFYCDNNNKTQFSRPQIASFVQEVENFLAIPLIFCRQLDKVVIQ